MKIDTLPKLYKSAKGWYINYFKDGKQIRNSFGFNKIANLDQREAMYNQMIKKIVSEMSGILSEHANMNFLESLEFAMKKKSSVLSPKTISDYNGTVKAVKKAVVGLKFQNLPIRDARRLHIKLILEKAQELQSWSNHNYNKRLDHLKAILSELIQFDIIETNPAHGIKKLIVEDSIAHTPPTPKQAKQIREVLEVPHYNFWIYIFMMYDTGIRPVELLRLKLSQIDMSNDLITVLPRDAKNRKRYRLIGISALLKSYLLTLNFEDLPKDYYLFGSFRISGKGNIGKEIDFIPAPTQMKRDTATKRWEKLIILGAKITVSMYSAKKLGANNKLKAGIPLNVISEQFGHSEQETTKIYTTQLEQINRDLIKDKNPDWY